MDFTSALTNTSVRQDYHNHGDLDGETSATKGISACDACASQLSAEELASTSCGHHYCSSCLETIFTTAIKDEAAYPPRCCAYVISLQIAQQHLPRPLVREFKSRQLELSVKDRTYCHRPACSTFIKPHSIHNGQAICQSCNARTCANCKAEWHFGPCATVDPEIMKMADLEDWKRCPECRNMIELVEGCNDMV